MNIIYTNNIYCSIAERTIKLRVIYHSLLQNLRFSCVFGRSNCDSAAANDIREHYTRPYFLPAASEASKMDWIFMGTPGYGAHLHVSFLNGSIARYGTQYTERVCLERP